jgi:S-adenosylmethionine-dependent methyltransferase
MNNDTIYETLKDFLLKKYFSKYDEKYLKSKEFQKDLENHLYGRYVFFKNLIDKWISKKINLNGKKCLEMGCGTGSSTLAFAEMCDYITAVDIDFESIEIARKRLELYGKMNKVTFKVCDKIIKESDFCDKYDIVIFPAVLEHMTIQERISNLKVCWNLLKNNAFLIVLECPNRLWYFDHHTTFLPFYNWLEEDIALLYYSKTKRDFFQFTPIKNRDELYRYGRGVSFHEFELAFNKNFNEIDVFSYLSQTSNQPFINKIKHFLSIDYLYKIILNRITNKELNPGFLEPFLNLIIRKT